MMTAMSQLQGLVDTLPELPDEVQGALAVKVPGLLETPAAEVKRCSQCVLAFWGGRVVLAGGGSGSGCSV
jgi:hypothetical protein